MNTPKSRLRTILPFVAASGRVWMIVLIYKDMSQTGTKKESTVPVTTELRNTRSSTPTYYATTANGFITNDLWKQIIARLVERLSAFKCGQPALLLLDRHTTHMELSSVNLLLDSNVQPLYLPAHTTHLLQPLDDVIFGSFKLKVRAKRDLEKMRRLLCGEVLHSVIEDIITEEKSNIFEESVIQAEFKHTGIWPFNKALILTKFQNAYMFPTKSKPNTTEEEQVKAMALIVKDTILPEQPKTQTKRVRINEKNKLMTGQQLIIFQRQKEETEAKEKEAKELVKKEREDKKRKRQQEQVERAERSKQRKIDQERKVAEKTCSMCQRIYTVKHKFWVCYLCNQYRACVSCQEKKNIEEQHIADCRGDSSFDENEEDHEISSDDEESLV